MREQILVSCFVARRSRKCFTGCSILRYGQLYVVFVEQAFLIIENMEKYGIEDENNLTGTSRPSTSKSRNTLSAHPQKDLRSIGKSRPNTAASSDLLLEAATIEHNESRKDESKAAERN